MKMELRRSKGIPGRSRGVPDPLPEPGANPGLKRAGAEANGGLLRKSGCANLDFCAVVRPERECVRARLRGSKKMSGAVSGGKGWRSSAGRASDL